MGGTPLDWDRLVRLVYLNEAGVANRFQEPYLAACGVILNADQDYRPIERHLQYLVRKHVDDHERLGFVFHAKEIWHGNKEFDRRRERWIERESRLQVLQDLADVVPKFHLSVVCGYVHRLPFDEYTKQSCIGMSFALAAAAAVLATLLRSVRLGLPAGHEPGLRLRVTLRPAAGMPMLPRRRAA